MRKFFISISILFLWAFGHFTSRFSPFGRRPSKSDKNKFKVSDHFNYKRGVFENQTIGLIRKMKRKNLKKNMIKAWFDAGEDRVPLETLPEVKPNIEDFLKPSDSLKTIWFGHSTLLLNLDGKIILIDPVFSKSASPVNWILVRFQNAILELEELPEIDYIVISHDHYDHLDMETIKFFLDKKRTKFITPLGVGSHLTGWGIEKN